MTPETARQTIQALLDLGTLQGVRVEYEHNYTLVFFKSPDGMLLMEEGGQKPAKVEQNGWYKAIKSIHPIPLQPKLLEVGDRVVIISGIHESKVGKIKYNNNYEYGISLDETKEIIYVNPFQVIPESLLVEEEESETQLVNATLPLNTPIILERKGENIGYKLVKE